MTAILLDSPEMVVLPEHYARFKFEPIRFLVENYGPPIIIANIIKYVMRYDAKNGIEDLKKAMRYTHMLIEFTKGNPDWWRADRTPAAADTELMERRLVAVMNFPTHTGDHSVGVKGSMAAGFAQSYRNGWHDAVMAIIQEQMEMAGTATVPHG